ncbi:MAG: energy transducer TonB, partial [Silvibacterium sp.]
CFEKNSPALRLEVLRDGNMVFFNGVVPMNGQYLAKQIDVKFANLAVLNVQVTALEPLAKVNDAAFVPPAGAVRASLPPLFDPPGGMHLISSGKEPKAPAIALAAHVYGTVILAVTISTSGSVSDVRVISGPAILRQAAIDSVKTYQFVPFKVKGQATEVEILVRSEFRRD